MEESLVYVTLESGNSTVYLPWLYQDTSLGRPETLKFIFRALKEYTETKRESWEWIGARGGAYVWKSDLNICKMFNPSKEFRINLGDFNDVDFLLLDTGPSEAANAEDYGETVRELKETTQAVDRFRARCIGVEQKSHDRQPLNTSVVNDIGTTSVVLTLITLVAYELIKIKNNRR